MMEQKHRIFHVRIKKKKGYIALSYGVYGDYAVYLLTDRMTIFAATTVESWLYSTVNSTAKLEFGEWRVERATQTAQFGDLAKDQVALTELQF